VTLPRPGFRAKLLLALIGTVGLLLAATMVTIRVQTRQQVDVLVDRALERSRRAFAEQERARQERLRAYGSRFAGSNRLPAALDEAVANGAVELLLATTRYELELAGIPAALAAYTDAAGEPVGAVLDGEALAEPATAVPAPLVAWLLESGEGGAQGYLLAGGRLYGVHTVPLAIFGTAVGTLTLGFPVDDAVAAQLGETVGAEVCFVAAGRCVASTPGIGADGALHDWTVAMAGSRAPRRVRWEGRRLALVADRVSAGAGMRDVWRVVAVPLDDVLVPFDRIERAERLAGLGALALAIVLAVVLSRSLAGPVRALVAATERVARGDFSVRVDARRRDELGTLAEAFNQMTHGLMLKERYRGVLDKVVSHEIAEELLKGEITLGGETRAVTVLFADVRGFTTLSEGMEPQAVIALLNEVMERASAAVEAEGGVVDKYVGDEVMAVFGAPIARGREAERAVRAAVRIREALGELNAGRRARGLPAAEMGIGINTGAAVAGNMGSPGRLNYTVVGAAVNLAARLCARAGPSEILVSEATWAAVRDLVDARPLGPTMLRGLSAPVELYAVDAIRGDADRPAASPTNAAAAGVATALMLAMGIGLASPSTALAQGLPTFEEMGIGWTSADGTWQVTPSGRLDVEVLAPREVAPWLIPETDPFLSGRLSLFVDVFAGERVYGLVELRADRGEAPRDRGVEGRIEQAYVRVTPFPGTDVSVQAGKFVSPFGNWPQRHHSSADPFIRPPLPYDYRTMVSSEYPPESVDDLLAWKDEPEVWRPVGAPPVWGAPYQVGAMVLGAWKGASFRLAVMNSAPSSEPGEWNSIGTGEHGPSWVAHAGWQVAPSFRVGASYNTGSYLADNLGSPLPPGRERSDYAQELWGFEAAFTRGLVEARAELLLDRWEVPYVAGDARDVSYYVETKVKLTPGLFAAARYNAIRFNEIARGDGTLEAWDYDVERVQIGAGYRLSRTTEVRAEYMANFTAAPPDGDDDLLAVRWSWAF
jgi:class 3 adenylate cyclase